ncbi:MAG: hypothetical protein JWN57_66 [Frankiales bacterium]|jgi:hypothetical protein|nr:hypothetical protein [Frankiales bacterium]
MARKAAAITRLEEHPNLAEVLGVLAQLAHVADPDLPKLAESWHNTVALAEARDRALLPDSPLVCEVLEAFDAVSSLFEDDVRGEASYLTVDPATTVRALKAVRDAIAAAYARPALSRADHALLMRAWRTVYPVDAVGEPDLGPQGDQVRALLAAMPLLSTRCHDARGQALYEALVDQSFVQESARADARDTAFSAAVLTSRRRTWALVRRSGAEGLTRACSTCRTSSPVGARDTQRVLTVCLDAACALLVADTLPDGLVRLLTQPVAALIPLQRGPAASS